MGENSRIEWCDHTFNPWYGCTKVSGACDHCYAEAWAKRSGLVEWGNHPRRRTSPNYWRQPFGWDRRAERDGVRRKVFCASLADVFDNQADPAEMELRVNGDRTICNVAIWRATTHTLFCRARTVPNAICAAALRALAEDAT